MGQLGVFFSSDCESTAGFFCFITVYLFDCFPVLPHIPGGFRCRPFYDSGSVVDLIVAPDVCWGRVLYCSILHVLSRVAIISLRKRELVDVS